MSLQLLSLSVWFIWNFLQMLYYVVKIILLSTEKKIKKQNKTKILGPG